MFVDHFEEKILSLLKILSNRYTRNSSICRITQRECSHLQRILESPQTPTEYYRYDGRGRDTVAFDLSFLIRMKLKYNFLISSAHIEGRFYTLFAFNRSIENHEGKHTQSILELGILPIKSLDYFILM